MRVSDAPLSSMARAAPLHDIESAAKRAENHARSGTGVMR
jgi:hypothetical protein